MSETTKPATCPTCGRRRDQAAETWAWSGPLPKICGDAFHHDVEAPALGAKTPITFPLADVESILRVATGELDRGTPEQSLEYIAELARLILDPPPDLGKLTHLANVALGATTPMSAEEFYKATPTTFVVVDELFLSKLFEFAEDYAAYRVMASAPVAREGQALEAALHCDTCTCMASPRAPETPKEQK